jgi:iron complex outermembrane receptor protein
MRTSGSKDTRCRFPAVLLPAIALGTGLTAAPALAETLELDEIIVTARRTEETLQNVPIAMTVFSQQQLAERNVTNGADLAIYTPSLTANTRFGADSTTFAIRGFTQELRTTASVAVYFADVVAPRGGGFITGGDGAGPGAFFDLQNVQVLKGPQGTLFGRNTTGGAIQLTPQEPTYEFEGYLEESAGNYGMRRHQGVINIPVSDTLQARFGVDNQKRDGYLDNVSGIGPDHFADMDYLAGRASLIWSPTEDLQNYTIYSYTDSENNGSIQGLFACSSTGLAVVLFGPMCQSALEKTESSFYDVANDVPNPVSKIKQWQLINTTTWDVNDDFTVKNILSYADFMQTTRGAAFGANLQYGDRHLWLFPADTWHGIPSNSQETFVEELQFSGVVVDWDLTWQAGLYYEKSRPDGISGARTPVLSVCDPLGEDSSTWNCSFALPGGGVNSNLGTVEYVNQAAYAQSTYDISDEFRVTVGARYTVDRSYGDSRQIAYVFDPVTGEQRGTNCIIYGADPSNGCSLKLRQRSEAPTWLIDFDYLPSPDVLVYVKYARGYRQGSVNIGAPAGLQKYDPEEVDAYEIGAKTSFSGQIAGTFNISAFYNDLSKQQLQIGQVPCGLAALAGDVECTPPPPGFVGPATTSIENAGSSTIQGVEVDTTLKLTESLIYSLSYTYLDTHLGSLDTTVGAAGYAALPAAVEGGALSFSPRHSVTTGLTYNVPIPMDWGNLSAGGTYTYVSEQISTASTLGVLPSHHLVNVNLGWTQIAGSSFDAALFATNVTDEEYATYVPGLYDQLGMEFRVVGEPRMWGARVKYNFGG